MASTRVRSPRNASLVPDHFHLADPDGHGMTAPRSSKDRRSSDSLGTLRFEVHILAPTRARALRRRPPVLAMTHPDKLAEVFEKLHKPAGLESRLEERNETPLIWAVS